MNRALVLFNFFFRKVFFLIVFFALLNPCICLGVFEFTTKTTTGLIKGGVESEGDGVALGLYVESDVPSDSGSVVIPGKGDCECSGRSVEERACCRLSEAVGSDGYDFYNSEGGASNSRGSGVAPDKEAFYREIDSSKVVNLKDFKISDEISYPVDFNNSDRSDFFSFIKNDDVSPFVYSDIAQRDFSINKLVNCLVKFNPTFFDEEGRRSQWLRAHIESLFPIAFCYEKKNEKNRLSKSDLGVEPLRPMVFKNYLLVSSFDDLLLKLDVKFLKDNFAKEFESGCIEKLLELFKGLNKSLFDYWEQGFFDRLRTHLIDQLKYEMSNKAEKCKKGVINDLIKVAKFCNKKVFGERFVSDDVTSIVNFFVDNCLCLDLVHNRCLVKGEVCSVLLNIQEGFSAGIEGDLRNFFSDVSSCSSVGDFLSEVSDFSKGEDSFDGSSTDLSLEDCFCQDCPSDIEEVREFKLEGLKDNSEFIYIFIHEFLKKIFGSDFSYRCDQLVLPVYDESVNYLDLKIHEDKVFRAVSDFVLSDLSFKTESVPSHLLTDDCFLRNYCSNLSSDIEESFLDFIEKIKNKCFFLRKVLQGDFLQQVEIFWQKKFFDNVFDKVKIELVKKNSGIKSKSEFEKYVSSDHLTSALRKCIDENIKFDKSVVFDQSCIQRIADSFYPTALFNCVLRKSIRDFFHLFFKLALYDEPLIDKIFDILSSEIKEASFVGSIVSFDDFYNKISVLVKGKLLVSNELIQLSKGLCNCLVLESFSLQEIRLFQDTISRGFVINKVIISEKTKEEVINSLFKVVFDNNVVVDEVLCEGKSRSFLNNLCEKVQNNSGFSCRAESSKEELFPIKSVKFPLNNNLLDWEGLIDSGLCEKADVFFDKRRLAPLKSYCPGVPQSSDNCFFFTEKELDSEDLEKIFIDRGRVDHSFVLILKGNELSSESRLKIRSLLKNGFSQGKKILIALTCDCKKKVELEVRFGRVLYENGSLILSKAFYAESDLGLRDECLAFYFECLLYDYKSKKRDVLSLDYSRLELTDEFLNSIIKACPNEIKETLEGLDLSFNNLLRNPKLFGFKKLTHISCPLYGNGSSVLWPDFLDLDAKKIDLTFSDLDEKKMRQEQFDKFLYVANDKELNIKIPYSCNMNRLKQIVKLFIHAGGNDKWSFSCDCSKIGNLNKWEIECLRLSRNKLSDNLDFNLAKYKRLYSKDCEIILEHFKRSLRNNTFKKVKLSGFGENIDLLFDILQLIPEDIIELDLSGNDLSKVPFLPRFKKLEQLNLSDNFFLEVPILTSLLNLKKLNLSNNRIGGMLYLSAFQSIDNLDLRGNLCLLFFDIEKNGWVECDLKCFGGGKKVEFKCANKDIHKAINIFTNNADLSLFNILDLSNNNLTAIPDLSSFKALEELILDYNNLGENDQFSEAISHLSGLKQKVSLSLKYNGLNVDQVKHLVSTYRDKIILSNKSALFGNPINYFDAKCDYFGECSEGNLSQPSSSRLQNLMNNIPGFASRIASYLGVYAFFSVAQLCKFIENSYSLFSSRDSAVSVLSGKGWRLSYGGFWCKEIPLPVRVLTSSLRSDYKVNLLDFKSLKSLRGVPDFKYWKSLNLKDLKLPNFKGLKLLSKALDFEGLRLLSEVPDFKGLRLLSEEVVQENLDNVTNGIQVLSVNSGDLDVLNDVDELTVNPNDLDVLSAVDELTINLDVLNAVDELTVNPDDLDALSAVDKLTINSDDFKKLDISVQFNGLKTLNLVEPEKNSVTKWIDKQDLRGLKHLGFICSKGEYIGNIMKSLPNLNDLEALRLSSVGSQGYDFSSLMDLVLNIPSLKNLRLEDVFSNNDFFSYSKISEVFQKCESLSLRGNCLGEVDDRLGALLGYLDNCIGSKLKYLDLANNNLKESDLERIVGVLSNKSKFPNLIKVNFAGNYFPVKDWRFKKIESDKELEDYENIVNDEKEFDLQLYVKRDHSIFHSIDLRDKKRINLQFDLAKFKKLPNKEFYLELNQLHDGELKFTEFFDKLNNFYYFNKNEILYNRNICRFNIYIRKDELVKFIQFLDNYWFLFNQNFITNNPSFNFILPDSFYMQQGENLNEKCSYNCSLSLLIGIEIDVKKLK